MARRKPFPGVTRVKDRHGKVRWRFRSRGFSAYLPGPYGSAAFVAAYELARTGKKPDGSTPGKRLEPGTIKWLLHSYQQTPGWANLAPITRKNLSNEIKWLEEQAGDLPFIRFGVQHVEALMAKKAGRPAASNKVRKLLSRLFRHAIRLGLMTENPAALAQSYKTNPHGFHTWTAAEIVRFRQYWPVGSAPRRALELALNTGVARQDMARMGWQNVEGGKIRYARGKSGQAAVLPILPELAAELVFVPRSETLLWFTHTSGRPYTPASFGNWFKDRCADAGLAHCNLHGLRKALAVHLAENEATENEIAAVLTHANTRQASTYTKGADRERLAEKLLSMRPNVTNLSERLDECSRKRLTDKE